MTGKNQTHPPLPAAAQTVFYRSSCGESEASKSVYITGRTIPSRNVSGQVGKSIDQRPQKWKQLKGTES